MYRPSDLVPHQVLLHHPQTRCWLSFQCPRAIVTTHRKSEVIDCLHDIEQRVEQEQWYAAGFVSYEAAIAFDSAFSVHADPDFPLLWFGLYDRVDELKTLPVEANPQLPELEWQPSITQEDYNQAIAAIRHHIYQGDTYQVNFTFRLRSAFRGNPARFFLHQLASQHPPYGAFLDIGSWQICSASPELFLQREGDRIWSRPMKGTSKRGLTWDRDRQLSQKLQQCDKNRAENVMIVDMVRNDLGQIAELGSVNVTNLFALEKYPTLWQLTTTVQAQTQAGFVDTFRALFPPASITGAPKPSTMNIITQLETTPRRIYTGTIGYLQPGQQAQFNVAIRTVLINRDRQEAEYGVGGGIVWDSQHSLEFEECQTKAQVLFQTRCNFSLLETLLWTSDQGYHLLEQHLQRLTQSADYFNYPLNDSYLQTKLTHLARSLSSQSSPQKIRILVNIHGEINCQSSPYTMPDFSQPLAIPLAKTPVDANNPFLYHKTTHRQVYQEAIAPFPNAPDVILYNQQGYMTESTIANLAVEIDGTLYTPPIHDGLLAGTYRNWMLSQRKLCEKSLTLDHLLHGDRIFLMNSLRGLYEIRLQQ